MKKINELKGIFGANFNGKNETMCLYEKNQYYVDGNNIEQESISIEKLDKYISEGNIPTIAKNVLLNCKKFLHKKNIDDIESILEYVGIYSLSTMEEDISLLIGEEKSFLEFNKLMIEYIKYYDDREDKKGYWLFSISEEAPYIDDEENGKRLIEYLKKQDIEEKMYNILSDYAITLIFDIIEGYIYYLFYNSFKHKESLYN